jgi:hypothetical protein
MIHMIQELSGQTLTTITVIGSVDPGRGINNATA